eukprot:7598822-Pyramimonas_sp.AAC.1
MGASACASSIASAGTCEYHLSEWDGEHSGTDQRCDVKQGDAVQHAGGWARGRSQPRRLPWGP